MPKTTTAASTRAEIESDIRNTLGLVPSFFHTEAAKLFGATDEEIQEAVHYAKHSVGWSAYANGMQIDYDEFADELEKIGDFLTKQPPATTA